MGWPVARSPLATGAAGPGAGGGWPGAVPVVVGGPGATSRARPPSDSESVLVASDGTHGTTCSLGDAKSRRSSWRKETYIHKVDAAASSDTYGRSPRFSDTPNTTSTGTQSESPANAPAPAPQADPDPDPPPSSAANSYRALRPQLSRAAAFRALRVYGTMFNKAAAWHSPVSALLCTVLPHTRSILPW